ncbi:Transmembrane 9 superfamily member 3 [Apodemus speciosus]|uniref:Transmembrane 9 superfamily member n=1 Tax=Apodemus speciosus TaxID=105296 RepID=A0ABQ0FTL1_APOSI
MRPLPGAPGVAAAAALLLLLLPRARSDEHEHTYQDKEEVVLWMNTVGPYHNRQETYKYFSLPFCVGSKKSISHYHETLGEALQGVELEFSGLDIKFKDDVMPGTYCEIDLDKEKRDAFVYAIKNHYWYQMYIDDLPIWGIVGEADENGEDYYLWTYKKLEIGFNGNRIVDVNLTSEGKVKLVPNTKIQMSYSVKWKKSDVKFEDRFDKYLDPSFFQHRIHWFSIFNSFMMVIFLVGLVSMILMRTLRKDYARYSKEEEMDDMDRDLGDEYGWKQVHGDVFRPSSHPLIFSSLIGSGCQIFAVSLIVIIVAMIEDLYTDVYVSGHVPATAQMWKSEDETEELFLCFRHVSPALNSDQNVVDLSQRGSMLSTAIFVYAATSPVNGYFGGSLYARQGGRRWIKQMFIGAFLIPAMVCGTAFFINFIAIYYHASRAIPFGTMGLVLGLKVAVCCICFFVILPLNLVGTILGRNLSGQPNFPCRVNAVPRPIPEKKWFMEPAVIVCLGGILPFGSIFIEMYFIFTSFWAYKIYYVYGFMMLVLVILCIVTVCVTIVCTYFLLNAEDYRWQWTSFLSAASTAIYVYMYSFYYYFFKTKMYGLFQTSFYFGYMAVFSTALGIMCGAIGYMGTSAFVRKIYTNVKID